MFENILGYEFLGNNIVQYLVFIAILIGAVIVAKIVYWLFSKTFTTFTKKTKNRLDDIMVQTLQEPIIFAVLLLGVHLGMKVLLLTDAASLIYTKIISVAFTLCVSWFVMRIVGAILENYIVPLTEKSKSKFDDTLFPVIKNLVNFAIIAITIIMILQNLGYEVSGLVAGLGIGGLAFALAAQDLLGNMFGGAAIIADKPFKIGDRVKVDGRDGFVKKITLRTTTLKTFGGTTVVMPNKKIADSTLENVSSEKMRRVKLVLGLTYDTTSKQLEQAKQIIEDILEKHPDVYENRFISFHSFSASSLDIQVIYYIKDLNNILSIKDDINMEIKIAFDKAKLDFAFPTQTVYLKK